MRFLNRHRFFLIFLGVLVFCDVLVVRQFLVNQWAHANLREDFILLNGQNRPRTAERLYQQLIQELPGLPVHVLLEDDQRLTWLVDQTHPSSDDLVWKYHISVQNELQRRLPQRMRRALKRAGSE
ncbi:MAG: hypothetical protein KGJ60_04140 [Verrucomicrobiota bacterium]|nr:hypothetical protein [Verrucomicrobiota bacterium]